MKTYIIKKLIDGSRIHLTGTFVGVPDIDWDRDIKYNDGQPFLVRYENKEMVIQDFKEAKTYRTFQDREGRGSYILGYFEWKEGEN
jgi:hypothetical protein